MSRGRRLEAAAGLAMAEPFGALMARHPGVFREVIPGFIATDLIFAAFLVFIWTKAANGFGGGPKGGAAYGAWMGAFFGISANLYYFFGFTFLTVGDIVLDSAYTIITVGIQGAGEAPHRPAGNHATAGRTTDSR